jgi:hypothetical protein
MAACHDCGIGLHSITGSPWARHLPAGVDWTGPTGFAGRTHPHVVVPPLCEGPVVRAHVVERRRDAVSSFVNQYERIVAFGAHLQRRADHVVPQLHVVTRSFQPLAPM